MEKLVIESKDRDKALSFCIKNLKNNDEKIFNKAVYFLLKMDDKERVISILKKSTTNFGMKIKVLKDFGETDETLFDYCVAGMRNHNSFSEAIINLGELYDQRDKVISLLLYDTQGFDLRISSLKRLGATKELLNYCDDILTESGYNGKHMFDEELTNSVIKHLAGLGNIAILVLRKYRAQLEDELRKLPELVDPNDNPFSGYITGYANPAGQYKNPYIKIIKYKLQAIQAAIKKVEKQAKIHSFRSVATARKPFRL